MKKNDLIDVLQEKLNNKYFDNIKFSKADIDKILEGVSEVVTEIINTGDSIKLPNLGTFVIVERSARITRNPQTGQPMNVPAKKAVKFKAATTLKDSIQ